jgi:predicted nucleotidyltransferase
MVMPKRRRKGISSRYTIPQKLLDSGYGVQYIKVCFIENYLLKRIVQGLRRSIVDKTLLPKAVDRLTKRFRPDRIILFGSQARGTADARSDVDLPVISRFRGKRRELLAEMYRELRDSGIVEKIVLLTPEEFERDQHIPGTIAHTAAQKGKLLYERT